MKAQGILNKGFEQLSAGTRVDIINMPEGTGDDIPATCRLANKPSFKLREQGFPEDGIICIPISYLTLVRPRSEEVPAKSRSDKRIDKQIAYEMRKQIKARTGVDVDVVPIGQINHHVG